VCVSYVVAEDSIVMIVEDQGAGIAPDESPEPTPTPLEGGMGISIISAVVDDLDVRAGADGRGTVVRMTKRLNIG
jgi:anti-sigma regulatory factor (Ser/Thr protein kinase)